MKIQTPRYVCQIACLAFWLALPGAAQETSEETTPEATYRVAVTPEELASWIDFRGTAPFLRGQSAIDGLVLVKTVAEHAMRTGLDQTSRPRMELARETGQRAVTRLRQEVAQNLEVSPEEVKAQLGDDGPITRPAKIRLRNLFRRFPADPDGRQAVREAMKSYREQVLAGADFAELASQVSESETRWRGGLVGNVRPGTFRPEVDQILRDLEPGEVSEILATEDGLTLLYCESILPAVTRSAEERYEAMEKRLRRHQFNRRWEELREELMERSRLRHQWPALVTDSTILARFHGGHLTSEALQALSNASNLDFPELNAIVERFVFEQMAVLYVKEHGLAYDDRVRSHARWRELQILTSHQLAAWVGERFEEPTDDAVRAYYDRHRSLFQHPEMLDLSLIRLPRGGEDPREDYRRAAELLTSIRSGELTFAEAAREHSQHPSASNGGRVPNIQRSRLSSRLGLDLTRAVRALDLGEVSELVSTEEALWILRVNGVEAERQATLEEAQVTVRQRLIEERLDELQAQVVEEWLEGLAVEYRE